jgi:hypothetical protein
MVGRFEVDTDPRWCNLASMADSDSADPRSSRGLGIHQIKNGDYYLVRAPVGYPGKIIKNVYAYAHHVGWWIKTGTAVPDGYHVHHDDENTENNDPDNLVLLTNEEHSKLHGLKRRTQRSSLICTQCNITFERRSARVKYDNNLRKIRKVFCSKKCLWAFLRTTNADSHGTVAAYMRCGPPTCSACREAIKLYKRMKRADGSSY